MKKALVILAMLLSGCAAQNSKNTSAHSSNLSDTGTYLQKGYTLLSNRETKDAIGFFDKAIEQCKDQYNTKGKKVYASRGATEALYYMMKAATDKQGAITVAPTCADALYLKGYAMIDLGRIKQAQTLLQRAVDMSPVNSMYLSELGYVYQAQRDWKTSLDLFKRSEESAPKFSPPELKTQELTRAKRGIGYSLIELGRLDEAEKKFDECLAINKNDQSAIRELKYIQQLRNSPPPQ